MGKRNAAEISLIRLTISFAIFFHACIVGSIAHEGENKENAQCINLQQLILSYETETVYVLCGFLATQDDFSMVFPSYESYRNYARGEGSDKNRNERYLKVEFTDQIIQFLPLFNRSYVTIKILTKSIECYDKQSGADIIPCGNYGVIQNVMNVKANNENNDITYKYSLYPVEIVDRSAVDHSILRIAQEFYEAIAGADYKTLTRLSPMRLKDDIYALASEPNSWFRSLYIDKSSMLRKKLKNKYTLSFYRDIDAVDKDILYACVKFDSSINRPRDVEDIEYQSVFGSYWCEIFSNIDNNWIWML